MIHVAGNNEVIGARQINVVTDHLDPGAASPG